MEHDYKAINILTVISNMDLLGYVHRNIPIYENILCTELFLNILIVLYSTKTKEENFKKEIKSLKQI